MAREISVVSPDGRLRVAVDRKADDRCSVLFQTLSAGEWFTVALFQESPWRISSAWRDGPVEWKIVPVVLVEKPSSRTILVEGEIETGRNRYRLTDRYAFAHRCILIKRVWKHLSLTKDLHITFGLDLKVPFDELLRRWVPGVLANCNPSSSSLSRRLKPPRMEVPSPLLVEEHRLPVPFVSAEVARKGTLYAVSLVTVPSPLRDGNVSDQSWSIGMEERGGGLFFLSRSGEVAASGRANVIYARPGGFESYGKAFINPSPRAQIEKSYFLGVSLLENAGDGLRPALRASYRIFSPLALPRIPLEQFIRLKIKAALARLFRGERAAGFFVSRGSRIFDYGWPGRSISVAASLIERAGDTGEELLEDVGREVVDFFVKESLRRQREMLPRFRYNLSRSSWAPQAFVSSRDLGGLTRDLSFAIEALGARKRPTRKWKNYLFHLAGFLASQEALTDEGLFPDRWNRDARPIPEKPSAAGIFCVEGLLAAYAICSEKRWLKRACELLGRYYSRHAETLEHPFWQRLTNPPAEDRDSACAFIRSCLMLHSLDKEPEYLLWARRAADWVLTFVYTYDVRLPEGSPLYGRIDTIGWSSPSVGRHLLDVRAPAWEFLELGRRTGEPLYAKVGESLFAAVTQTVETPDEKWGFGGEGEQVEEYFQTNFTSLPGKATGLRGGLSKSSRLWVTAHLLEQALRLRKIWKKPIASGLRRSKPAKKKETDWK